MNISLGVFAPLRETTLSFFITQRRKDAKKKLVM
jgi:hypothetical protein